MNCGHLIVGDRTRCAPAAGLSLSPDGEVVIVAGKYAVLTAWLESTETLQIETAIARTNKTNWGYSEMEPGLPERERDQSTNRSGGDAVANSTSNTTVT